MNKIKDFIWRIFHWRYIRDYQYACNLVWWMYCEKQIGQNTTIRWGLVTHANSRVQDIVQTMQKDSAHTDRLKEKFELCHGI